MTFSIPSIFLISILFISCSNGQAGKNPATKAQHPEAMDNFEFSFKTAHPKAQTLMADEFYWSPYEESAPFGSDAGSDAAYGFRKWRLFNKTSSPVNYLTELIDGWQFPFFDYNEMDTTIIKEYIAIKANLDEATIQKQIQTLKEINKESHDTSRKLDDNQLRKIIISAANGMGGTYLLAQDNAIIGTGFAQIALEGHIDNDIKKLTITAINRQLLPLLINSYDDNYRPIREQQLTKMREVIYKASL